VPGFLCRCLFVEMSRATVESYEDPLQSYLVNRPNLLAELTKLGRHF
jgi:hypothetical protein